jgi:hypothetical protein
VRHRALSGAPATSPGRWVSTVGASDNGATGQSGGALDRSCSLSGAPSGACFDFCVRSALFTVALQTTIGAYDRCSAWHTGQSSATSDSPVNYSGAASPNSQRWQVWSGTPWCTGHYPMMHRTLSGGTPDSPVRQTRAAFGSFAPLLLNPFFELCVGLL